ncbi:MAG TPA: hypothetical protein VF062_18345 [Candidatus Limnocylindrales bacterium]
MGALFIEVAPARAAVPDLTMPAAATNPDGRMEVFAVGTDRALYHKWQLTPGGGWSHWEGLGGPGIRDVPVVGRNANGRLVVIVAANDGTVWRLAQSSSGWGAWIRIGGVSGVTLRGTPAVGQNLNGTLEVFMLGSNQAIYHAWQTSPNGGWTGFHSMGGIVDGFLGQPAVARNRDGRLEVVAVHADFAIWRSWQLSPSGGWSGWHSLGGILGNPAAVATNADGRLEVFANEPSNNNSFNIWQLTPGGGWSGWNNLDHGVLSRWSVHPLQVAANADGRLELFSRKDWGGQGDICHRWQTSPGGGWTATAPCIGGQFDFFFSYAVGRNADGRLEVFADNANGPDIKHAWQMAPSGGWTGWVGL